MTAAAIVLAAFMPAGFTYRDLARHAKVGYEAARTTLKRMVKDGDLRPVGTQPVKGCKRPLSTYKLASAPAGAADLFCVIRGWSGVA